MIRTAVAVRRIAMARLDNLRLEVRCPGNPRVEIGDFKPQEHAVSRRKLRIADASVMMLHVPMVQLKNQPAIRNESFVMRTSMVAPATKELLIPSAARFNVADANQGLRIHE